MTIKLTPFKTISLSKTSQIDQLTAWLKMSGRERGISTENIVKRIKSKNVMASNTLFYAIIKGEKTIDDMTLKQIRELHAIYLENYDESSRKSEEQKVREQKQLTAKKALNKLL